MSEEWKNYFCNVNDKLASIALDLELAAKAPISAKPALLWVWVYLRFPRADGLTTQADFESLSPMEDALAEALKRDCAAVQAGRITTDGRREMYFYARSDSMFKAAIAETMRRFAEYKYELGSKKDCEWKQYFEVLYPSTEELQKIKNGDVIDVLMEHGDNLTSERDVDHWIYFRCAEDRSQFSTEARELGYRIVSESMVVGERRFGLQVCRSQSVTPDEIDAAVIELFRLAEGLDAEYDGWETQVVTVKN